MRKCSTKKGHYVFCTYYTRKDGTRIYAKDLSNIYCELILSARGHVRARNGP